MVDSDHKNPTTPALAQYLDIKHQHQDSLVFYRLGDFYELFFEDAVQASKILGLVLTKRGQYQGQDVPMCGVPAHAAENYLAKLIQNGRKVAICEQMEEAEQVKKREGKNIIQRRVVRIMTPGTLTEENLLNNKRYNYLAALCIENGLMAGAWIDLSTADFYTAEIPMGQLLSWLERLSPRELLISDENAEMLVSTLSPEWRKIVSIRPKDRFDPRGARQRLQKVYDIQSLEGLGSFSPNEIAAAGALMEYIELTQQGRIPLLKPLKRVFGKEIMEIDAFTWRSLEIDRTQSNHYEGSLLQVIDRTSSAAGSRCLSAWLAYPLTDTAKIISRQEMVEFLIIQGQARIDTQKKLAKIPDLQRALSRLMIGRGSPRDLGAIQSGLQQATAMKENLSPISMLPKDFKGLLAELGYHQPLIERLAKALTTTLPLDAKEGGFIVAGYHQELDKWRHLRDDSRQEIAVLENQYRGLTGLTSLKIKYNNILGYYIETTTVQSPKLFDYPDKTFIHRQTMAGAVRFVTTVLSELQQKIFQAADKALALELLLFQDLVQEVKTQAAMIQKTADALAHIDVIAALAALAVEQSYCRPLVDHSVHFDIKDGRHPVVEYALMKDSKSFIANDCNLSAGQQLWLITGPNMAGKSTYLRQNALIAILAQIGSFVPAMQAKIGVVDKLFSRVGAADDLARGQSTFMVEMLETAAILNQATDRSLVILDEIGRGTSTFDGLAIAWAVLEHLHDTLKSRSLFATHYRELAGLGKKLSSMRAYCFKLKEWQETIVFLHQLIPGVADRSYGIDVARLAGVPKAVISRARKILTLLETNDNKKNMGLLPEGLPLFSDKPISMDKGEKESDKLSAVEEAFLKLDVDALSPRQALEKLYELQKLATNPIPKP